ncbi:MAG: hypothetical protein ABW184_04500 [Sphingobium sp.]
MASIPIVSVDPVTIEVAGRPVAVRITAPQSGNDLPVLVFSHGAAMNRSDYRPLVEGLARAGYVVVQPDHPDASDDGIAPPPWPDDSWRVRAETLLWIGGNLSLVLQEIPALVRRTDLSRVAVAGHSFGGHSAALAMGALVEGMERMRARPYRAAVLLAPPGNHDGMTPEWKPRSPHLKVDWSTMQGPALMIVGTVDVGPMSDLGPAWHEDGFRDASAGQDISLMRLEGAGHYLGGIDSALRGPVGDTTAQRRADVLRTMIAFLDHALARPSEAARLWPSIRSALLCK